ncbi:MAG TPA: type II secretion system protein [Solirubrobacterales bacterium]
MTFPPAKRRSSESGFVLLEVLVSAAVVVIASAGVMTLMQATVATQSDQRHGAEAYALAQEDQARMASKRLSQLNHLDETRVITVNKTEFKVRSQGIFVNDTTSTVSCGSGTSSGDYVQITSIVTWEGMRRGERAKIESILSPSNGSLNANNGTLAVAVTNEALQPQANVFAEVGGIAGFTNAEGCVTFPDLPAGNLIMTVNAEAAGLVNKDGLNSEKKEVGVVSGDTKNVSLRFDRPGTIPVKFKYRVGSGTEFRAAAADSIVAYNNGMTSAKPFYTAAAVREPTVKVAPLFPFSSAYTVYAGTCASNNPNLNGTNPPGAPATATAIAPRGGEAAPVTIQLPALETIVKNGATALSGARVTITDTSCKDALNVLFKRVYTTNSSGAPASSSTGVAEPGLPYGTYEICASAEISGSKRRKKVTNVAVQSLTSATTKTIDLGSGAETGSTAVCP